MILRPEIEGPVWTDHCKHPKESYVCSFECSEIFQDDTSRITQYDLYVYDSKCSIKGHMACLRYGSGGSEYCSAGPIVNLFTINMPTYKIASELLLKKGYLKWERK